jgi:hypothetical protein
MRPINELSNVEKAILMHQLLPGEIRGFLAGLQHYALETIRDEEQIKKDWALTAYSAGCWIGLAKKADQTINHRISELTASPELFARELFAGYMGLFTLDYMKRHGRICTDRFSSGIRFLFDLEVERKLPF